MEGVVTVLRDIKDVDIQLLVKFAVSFILFNLSIAFLVTGSLEGDYTFAATFGVLFLVSLFLTYRRYAKVMLNGWD